MAPPKKDSISKAIGGVVSGLTKGTPEEEEKKRQKELKQKAIAEQQQTAPTTEVPGGITSGDIVAAGGKDTPAGQKLFDEMVRQREAAGFQGFGQRVEGVEATSPETFSNETGRLSGVTIPSTGASEERTFLGLSPDEVGEIAGSQAGAGLGPLGAAPVGTAQAQANREQQASQLQAQATQPLTAEDLAAQAETAQLDYVAAFFKAVPNMVPDILQIVGGVAVGLGAVGTGGLTLPVAIGLIGNGVRGAYGDVIREIEGQKGEFSRTQEVNLEEGKQVLNDILSARNAGASSPSQSTAAWQRQFARIQQSYYNIQLQQSKSKFIGEDLSAEIAEFETYFSGEYLAQLDEFGLALSQPDIARITMSERMKKDILNKIGENVK